MSTSIILVLAACGGEESAEPKNNDEGATEQTPEEILDEAVAVDVEKVTAQKCMQCHGQDLKGGRGPELATVGSRLTKDEIKAILLDGNKTMPPNLLKTDEEVEAVSEWLAARK